jgi:hypothetical protein
MIAIIGRLPPCCSLAATYNSLGERNIHMSRQNSKNPPLLEDLERHYLHGTKPQEVLPFHIRVRRLHPWWPGSERHGRLIDRLIGALVFFPGVVWAAVSFGWMPVLLIIAEIVLIRITVYRVLNGTILD